MNLKGIHILRKLIGVALVFAIALQAKAYFHFEPSPPTFFFRFLGLDTTRYPLSDRYGDPYTYPNRNPFSLQDTAFIKKNIIYDPLTREYYIEEKIGNQYYRTPVSFSMMQVRSTYPELLYFSLSPGWNSRGLSRKRLTNAADVVGRAANCS